ncbi:MAG: hypothetical protein ACQEWV_28755 [Bacillota bacterium]
MDKKEKEKLLNDLEAEQKNTAQTKGYLAAFKNKTVWGLVF